MRCNVCGQESDSLVKAIVEGTELIACEDCGAFGKILKKIESCPLPSPLRYSEETIQPKREIIEVITTDYARIIRNSRENLGLDQKNFAAKINEKISIVHKIETGSYTPDLKLAHKLEKILKISLIEKTAEIQQSYTSSKSKESEGFTLGDMIKRK